MREFIIEADGGSRGNPGPAGYGSVVIDAATGQALVERAEYIGIATNNVAEYRGLVAGLRAARELDPAARILVRMDSKLVVEQMSGRWKIKHPDMKPLAAEAARVFPPGQVTYEWMPRERNKHADRLANEAMDAGRRGEQWSPSESTAELEAGSAAARRKAVPEPSGPPGDAAAGAAKARAALARGGAGGRAGAASGAGASVVSGTTVPVASGKGASVVSGTAAPGASGSEAPVVSATADPVASATADRGASAPADSVASGPEAPAADASGAAAAVPSGGAGTSADDVRAARAVAATTAPGIVAPGTVPPGTVPSASVPPGTVPSASVPPGTGRSGERTPAGHRSHHPSGPKDSAAPKETPAAGWAPADLGPPATFVLLRHGETPLTPQKRFSGSGGTDPSLSDVGREQARRVGEALARRGTVQAVVASPLARTRETAAIVAARLGLDVSVEDGLRETDFGAWEGLTFGEVRERHPEDLDAWLADPAYPPTGGGESFAATAERIAATRDKLVAAYAGRTVLLVTHVTPIKTFVRLALGAPPESLFRMELSAASVSAVAYYADGNASVRLLNDTSHLR
ncbi:histidine phosphatase family protein [Streptomyces mangrovisoli]|uniref:Bifunctional RNase H/acid phosphatase n=1 Tax=Streptomyces mangrovisoli TaxID=1428628 RepID=A0A1J4NXF4_9ACTN|nr:histidine phosphatase family protein [Streptomyces mangrovisoli]OIJ67209.1 bifunctional RNase H/acid phosphatase [Streptomyces mangrovisoli]